MSQVLRFIHISDTHIAQDPDYDSYGNLAMDNSKAIVEYLNTQLPFEPDFVLHTGDVVYNPDPDAYPVAQEILGQLRYPTFYVRGNHDIPAEMREHLENLPEGEGKLDYDFYFEDYHVIVLDSYEHKTKGILTPEQLRWLNETLVLSEGESVIIALHNLPVETGVAVLDNKMILQNHQEFLDILYPHRKRIRGVFYGHIHRMSLANRWGILFCAAPAVWFQLQYFPNGEDSFVGDPDALPGFNIVTMTHDQTWITHHTIPNPNA